MHKLPPKKYSELQSKTIHLQSNLVATRSPYPLLRAGCLAAHRGDCLMLLGSPPDMVHNSRLRKTRSSTQQARLSRFELILKKGIHPCCSGFQVQGSANSPASMALFYSSLLYLYQDPYIITDFLDFCKCFFDIYLILQYLLKHVFGLHRLAQLVDCLNGHSDKDESASDIYDAEITEILIHKGVERAVK